MIRYVVYLLILILLAVSACTPSARPTQEPLPQPSASAALNASTPPTSVAVANSTPARVAVPTVAPTSAPKPRNVQVKVDTNISASAVIPATGGTLSVQAADGTKFTLTFPKSALLKDTKVTLTPVTGVDGLPFSGGLVGGVQMSPEGLRLLQPATLTIESSKIVAAQGFESVAFAYHQNGEGMYLSPSNANGNVLTLEVWHFSGVGAAQGTAAEIQTQQQQHVPTNPEDALAQRVAEYLSRQRQAQLRSEKTDPDFEKKMIEFAREWYDRFIAPQLPIALQDCEAAPEILSKALSWLRQVTLLGIDKEFQSENALIWETMYQAIVNCYNKEYDQCLIDNDIKHRSAMLGHLRQAALLGIEDRLDQSKVYKCPANYRVDGVYASNDQIPVKGDICGLDKPFILKVDGQNPSGGKYTGEFMFAPAGWSEGSWKHAATTCAPGGKCATINSGGTYQVKGVMEGKPVITIDPTTEAMAIDGGSGKTFEVPSWQFDLQPAAGGCSAK